MAISFTNASAGGGGGRKSNRDLFGALAPKPKPNGGKGPVSPYSKSWAPLAPVRNAPRSQPAKPAGTSRNGGGGGGRSYSGGGGGGSYGGGINTFSAPVEPVAPSEEDYLKGDATYQATISALAKQLANFNTDIDTQLAARKLDYDKALQQLGYMEGGGWNFEDQMTAAGRAYQSMLNDFASRNMVQSQAYGDAQNDLTRTLNQQYEGLNTSNTQFVNDMTRQKTKARDENTAATQAARAEAILRRAAQYGFGV